MLMLYGHRGPVSRAFAHRLAVDRQNPDFESDPTYKKTPKNLSEGSAFSMLPACLSLCSDP